MFAKLSKFILLLGMLGSLTAMAQIEAHVVTRNAPLGVVLVWSPGDTAAGYNIYRKNANALVWPRNPLNGNPIAFSGDCGDIQHDLVKGSQAWNLVANALATAEGLFNPCDLGSVTLSPSQEAALSILARANWHIAAALGLGFEDDSVTNGQDYIYEIRGVDEQGIEMGVLATGLTVTAGQPGDLPAAMDMAAQSGDSRVLLTWDAVVGATGYVVYRQSVGIPGWKRINDATVLMSVTTDLENNPIDTSGYLDEMAWQENGDPGAHLVDGVNIVGPFNGATYEYRVAAVDLLGNESSLFSDVVIGQPLDATSPQTPSSIAVSAMEGAGSNGALEIRWNNVARDVQGHPEFMQSFEVSRYEDAGSAGTVVATVAAPPAVVNQVFAIDGDPQLRSDFGPKIWYYRIRAIDDQGNASAYSAAASGYLKDIVAPDPPTGLSSEGFETYIRISWDLGNESDLDGYQLYRALCDGDLTEGGEREDSPWVLIDEISYGDAQVLAAGEGSVWLDDDTVPDGSPLCYAYLVKAKDTSQNTSGSWPPDFDNEDYVCQNLRDRTGPDPAVVTAADARDHAVLVSWSAPPIQDVKAYHVYRSEAPDTGYVWVGGRMVTEPSDPPIILTEPFTGNFSGCEDIPVTSQPYMGHGRVVDASADPKKIYYYKVLGVDVHGNESNLEDAVAVSTFTYTAESPEIPEIYSITQDPESCTLTVSWTPVFDSGQHNGFVVYREEVGGSGYYTTGGLITGNLFVDTGVVPGKTYNYRVQLLGAGGKPSTPSLPYNHLVAE